MFEWFREYEQLFARAQIVCFMLAMGATLTVGDFARIFRQPRSLTMGLIGQYVVVPALALAVNLIAGLDGGLAFGLILIAALPGSSLAKAFALLGRGNMALSITLTVVTTLASIVAIPFLLRWLAGAAGGVRVPVEEVFSLVLLYMLSPLAVGMIVAKLIPNHRKIFGRVCVVFGWILVVVMIAGSFGLGRVRPGEYGWKAPLAIVVYCLAAQQVVMLPYYVFHWPRADRLAIGIEATMRNINLALLLWTELFPHQHASDAMGAAMGNGVLYVILFYAAVALVAGLLLALNHLRLSRRERLPA